MFLSTRRARGLATAAAAATGPCGSKVSRNLLRRCRHAATTSHATVFFATSPRTSTVTTRTARPSPAQGCLRRWSEQLRGRKTSSDWTAAGRLSRASTSTSGGDAARRLPRRQAHQARLRAGARARRTLRDLYAFQPPRTRRRQADGRFRGQAADARRRALGERLPLREYGARRARRAARRRGGGGQCRFRRRRTRTRTSRRAKRCARRASSGRARATSGPPSGRITCSAPVSRLVANGLSERDRELYRLERGAMGAVQGRDPQRRRAAVDGRRAALGSTPTPRRTTRARSPPSTRSRPPRSAS